MMKTRWLVIGTAVVTLAACSKGSNAPARESLVAFDVEEPAPPTAAAATATAQIAYTYSLSYELPDADVAKVQASHSRLCNSLGPTKCIMIETSLSVVDRAGEISTGKTRLLVDVRLARTFGQRLDAAATDAGGKIASRRVSAEDLTKQLVDTEAKLRAKQALADRLLGLIKTGNGRVSDLVQAERAFADTQEELDAARSLRATLRQRVAMSEMNIEYGSEGADGTWAPVARSMRSIGDTFASSLGGLIKLLVAALPWAIVIGLLAFIMRRRGWRLAFWSRDAKAPAD